MKYIVIGLGAFGSQLSARLTSLGHEVIGADISSSICDLQRDRMTGIVCLDTSSPHALEILPLLDAEAVIVTIGEDFGSSIQTVAQLRKAGVKRIIARGFNDVHIGVLQVLGVEKIIFPESDGAESLAQSLTYGDFISSYQIDATHYIMEFAVPHQLVGATVEESALWSAYRLKPIAIKKPQQRRNRLGLSHTIREVDDSLSPQTILESGDILVVYGTIKSYDSFIRSLR